MYSGTTFRRGSGRIVGVHQKIDRIARRRLTKHIPAAINFPTISNIIHFEGKNGPDGLKLKGSSLQDEPWPYIDPVEPDDRVLLQQIDNRIVNLAKALGDHNDTRAAFEAAWLAHDIVDGLTPAHHYPLSSKKAQGRLIDPNHEVLTIDDEEIVLNLSRKEAILKRWEHWGTRGVIAHIMFEWGVASAIASDSFSQAGPTSHDIKRLDQYGFETLFMESLHKIHDLKMYDGFIKKGWTRSLAAKTKKILVPEIIKVVTLAWSQAIIIARDK